VPVTFCNPTTSKRDKFIKIASLKLRGSILLEEQTGEGSSSLEKVAYLE
jgi:hypothetical protein